MFTLDLHFALLHCHRIIRLLYLLALKKNPNSNFCSPIFYRHTSIYTHEHTTFAMVLRKSFPKCTTKNTHKIDENVNQIPTTYCLPFRMSALPAPSLEMCAFNFSFLSLNSTQTLFVTWQLPFLVGIGGDGGGGGVVGGCFQPRHFNTCAQ